VSFFQALLHQERLKIQKELPEASTLVRELQDFVLISPIVVGLLLALGLDHTMIFCCRLLLHVGDLRVLGMDPEFLRYYRNTLERAKQQNQS